MQVQMLEVYTVDFLRNLDRAIVYVSTPIVYTSLTHFQTMVAISRSVPLPVYLSSTVPALSATSRRLLRARTSVPMLRSIGMISAAWEALELWPCRRGTHWAPLARHAQRSALPRSARRGSRLHDHECLSRWCPPRSWRTSRLPELPRWPN